MGRQTNIKLRLTTGNLIFYKRNDEFYIRAKPINVKQTKATKQKSKLFGKASTIAKNIKNEIASVIPNATERDMQTRLRIAVLKYLNRQQTLAGFEFNSAAFIAERLKINITVTQTANTYNVQIPAFMPVEKIAAPAHTKRLILTLAGIAVNTGTGNIEGYEQTQLSISYDNNVVPRQQITFNLGNGTDSIKTLLIAALCYYKTDGNSAAIIIPRWQPTGIVWMG